MFLRIMKFFLKGINLFLFSSLFVIENFTIPSNDGLLAIISIM